MRPEKSVAIALQTKNLKIRPVLNQDHPENRNRARHRLAGRPGDLYPPGNPAKSVSLRVLRRRAGHSRRAHQARRLLFRGEL